MIELAILFGAALLFSMFHLYLNMKTNEQWLKTYSITFVIAANILMLYLLIEMLQELS